MMLRTIFVAACVAVLGSGGLASAQETESGGDEAQIDPEIACYNMAGTYEEIEAGCTFVIDRDGRSAGSNAWLHRGHARMSLGKREEAIPDYSEVIRRVPNDFVAWQWRGVALTELKRWEPGLADLLTATKVAPTTPATHNSLCWALALQGTDLNRALSYCNIGVGLMPTWSAVRDSRAMVHLKMGKFDRALADYEMCLQQNPDYAHYQYGRALTLKRLGRDAEANAARAEALETDAGVAAKYDGYGVTW